METVLVTGSGGYLGCVLVPHLLFEGYKVRAVDLYRHRVPGLLPYCGNPHLEIIRGDVRYPHIVQQILQGMDYIIPLAAMVGAPACSKDPFEAHRTNVATISSLIWWRDPKQKIISPCTNSGYGAVGSEEISTEDSPMEPVSIYAKTKLAAEKAVLQNANTLSFRFATAFGTSPRMRLDLLVNDFVYRAVTDKFVVLYEGHFCRNYIHVRDIARAFVHGMHNFESMKGKPYNCGLSDANLTKKQLCEAIQKEVPEFQWFEALLGKDPDKRDYRVSNERLEATGFKPKVSLQEGIKELVKAYKTMPTKEFCNG